MAEEMKPKKKRKPELHPIVKWLRTAGIAAELLGLGELVLAEWFWPAIGCIYLGFALLAVDVWFEPDFHQKWEWKASAWAIILLVAAGFSWKIVFVDAPLPVFALMTNGEYPDGTVLAGITWKREFTELDVDIQNPTEIAYEDCDLVIRPTEAIAAIAQSSPFSDVTFEDKNESALRLLDMNLGAGTSKVLPVVLLATDAGYRMRCTRLPAHSTIKIVVALVDMKWNPQRHPNIPLEQQVRDPNYVLRSKGDDFATYWFGHKEGDGYAPRPTSSEWLRVEGTYRVAHRTWHISQKIQIGWTI